MGKSIRSKIKRHWRSVARDTVYKPLAEERLMAQLSSLNKTVILQNGGSGSVSRLKAAIHGVHAAPPADAGLKVLEKFADRMAAADQKKGAKKNEGFSFLKQANPNGNKTEVPEWFVTPPSHSAFDIALAREQIRYGRELGKKKKELAEASGTGIRKKSGRRKVTRQTERNRKKRGK